MDTATATATLPEDLSTLDDDALNALLADIDAEFDALHDDGSNDIARLAELADAHDAVRAEQDGRAETAAAAQEQIAALAARIHPADDATPTEPDPDEPDPDKPADPADADADDKELVTASAARKPARPAAAAVARQAPRPVAPAKRATVTITAAADLPGISNGSSMDVKRIAVAMHDKARGLSDHSGRIPIASIESKQAVTLTTDPVKNQDLIHDLIGEPNAAALVASGGWCKPSIPLFNLFEIGDADGLIDLPGVNIPGGGIFVPSFFGFSDTAGALWTWTEAQDIAAATQPGGPDKPCLKIPCPTWAEVRLGAEGLCVTHGNLSDKAFPELSKSYVNVVINAHLHRLSAAKTAAIVATAVAVVPDASMLVSDAAGDLLGMIALQAADLRSQYRAARTRSVDVLLPDWTINVLRANVAKRAGVDLLNVSDGEIMAWLTEGNVRPQFLSDYQPLFNAAPSTRWPAAMEATMYFTGAYLNGDGGNIDLGVQRDSLLNSTNDFTVAWSEQFYAVAQVGPDARKFSVALTVDGVTACCA